MSGMGNFLAGFGGGYVNGMQRKQDRERQDRLDKQANELHTAKMSEILATQDERQRERDFREANVAALSTGKTDTGQVVTDAAGSNAYTKDADAAVVLQDMAQTANGGAQVAPATRVLTGMQGATQRGTIPGQQVFTDPAKAQEFAQSMPMSEYTKMQARKAVAEQYGKLEIADDMRAKLENLASKGVFKASSLLDSGNADGALKVLQDMNPDLVPKGAQFKQVDVPDMFDRTKTVKGWALVAPGAEGQPERVLVGDFRDAVFGYLTPQEQFATKQTLNKSALDARKTEVAERQAATAERKIDLLLMGAGRSGGGGSGGGGGGGQGGAQGGGGAVGWKERREVFNDFGSLLPDPKNAMTPQEAEKIQASNTLALAKADTLFSTNAQFGNVLTAPQLRAAMVQAEASPKSIRTQVDTESGMAFKYVVVNGAKVIVDVATAAAQKPAQTQEARGTAGNPTPKQVLATMSGPPPNSKEQELQDAYQAWQAAKPSWFSQRTPTSEAREREAEARYTELLRNQYQK